MNKYRNQPQVIGEEKYSSKRERDAHIGLQILERAGLITGLMREVPFVLEPGTKIDGEKRARPALRYIADFVYSDCRTGKVVVADAKGLQTPLYRAKKHMMHTRHGISVMEL